MDYHHLGRSFYDEARRIALDIAQEADERGLRLLGEEFFGEKFRALPEFATLEEARSCLCELRGALTVLFSDKRRFGRSPYANNDSALNRLKLLIDLVDGLYQLSNFD